MKIENFQVRSASKVLTSSRDGIVVRDPTKSRRWQSSCSLSFDMLILKSHVAQMKSYYWEREYESLRVQRRKESIFDQKFNRYSLRCRINARFFRLFAKSVVTTEIVSSKFDATFKWCIQISTLVRERIAIAVLLKALVHSNLKFRYYRNYPCRVCIREYFHWPL